jgi:ubiquinone/menaquinone biosynthesis C-methylase UbiE
VRSCATHLSGSEPRLRIGVLQVTPIASMSNKAVLEYLQDPNDGSYVDHVEHDRIYFSGGNSYTVHEGTPLLIDEENSIFSVKDIIQNKPTTQSSEYYNPKHLKNYVRQRLLPRVNIDRFSHERYSRLAKMISGGKVLVIGAGDKDSYYRRCFADSEVITSDVHLQFGVEFIIDAHQIPFKDSTFSLVLAAQVLEHTAEPWIVASEMQRVTKTGGYIQVEVPFVFPFHAAPYDFYRFTPSALRFLCPQTEIIKLEATEGTWSGTAVAASQALVDSFSNRKMRMAALAASRYSLWWMKYLDRFNQKRPFNMPKGFAVTYRKDGHIRTHREMLEEVRKYA